MTINSIASILDLWEGHKICWLFPVPLEKNLFFKEDCSPPEDYKVNMIAYFFDAVHSKFRIQLFFWNSFGNIEYRPRFSGYQMVGVSWPFLGGLRTPTKDPKQLQTWSVKVGLNNFIENILVPKELGSN